MTSSFWSGTLFTVLSLATLILVLPASSQQNDSGTGIISGSVVERNTRAPLSSVNISIPGTQRGTSTDSNGDFSIRGISPGQYRIQANLIGFTPRTLTDIVVSQSRPVQLTIELDESTIVFGGVETEAGYFTTSPDMPVSAQVQSYEEIRRLPGGFEDVLRAVSILPGIARAEGGRNDIIARGGAPSENLYLVDGIEVQNINHFGTQGSGGGPLSFINIDFVNSTNFSAGGFGVKYGDRLSSVLEIGLREGRTDRPGGKLTLSASQFAVNLEGPTGPDGSLLFSARRSYLDFIFKGAGFGFVPEYWDFTSKWKQGIGPRDELAVIAFATFDRVSFFNDTEEQIYDNSKILGNNQKQLSGGAKWRHLFSSGFFTLTFGQSYTEFEYRQSDTLDSPIFTSSSIEHESSLRGDLVLQTSRSTELSLGLQGRRIRFFNEVDLPLFVTPFGDSLEISNRIETSTYKMGGHLQLIVSFHSLSVTGGLRWNYFDLIGESSAFDPRFSASLMLSPLVSLKMSAGRYSQAPSYVWLESYPGNRNLQFITADQYVLGFDYYPSPDTRITVEAYRKNYRNYPASVAQQFLVLSNTGAGFGGSEQSFSSFGIEPLISAGTGWSRGMEFSLRKKISDIPVYGLLGMSLSETIFKALDGVERPSSYDQRFILNLGGGYLINEKWEVSGKFRFASGNPSTPFLPDGTKDGTTYNSVRLAANHSLDVRADRRWFFDSWTLIAYIDLQNIYNNKPSRAPRYNERTGEIEQEATIGILPSIGFSAEF